MIAHYCNSYCNKFTTVCLLLMHVVPPRIYIGYWAGLGWALMNRWCASPYINFWNEPALAARFYFYFSLPRPPGSPQWLFINITVPPYRSHPLLLPCFVARRPLPPVCLFSPVARTVSVGLQRGAPALSCQSQGAFTLSCALHNDSLDW